MKERFIPLLGAAVAFYIVFILLFPNTKIFNSDEKISLPTTEDKGKYGLYALKKWLSQSNIPVYSLRERYNELASEPVLSDTGNLLIVSLPSRLTANHNELGELSTWLKNGNHAILLVAMSDWPDWAKRSTDHTILDVLELFELNIHEKENLSPTNKEKDKNEDKIDKDNSRKIMDILKPVRHDRTLASKLTHPLTKNVKSLGVWVQETEGYNWRLGGNGQLRSVLPLFIDNSDDEPAIWLAFSGNSQLVITRHADIFSNRALEKNDNAILIKNIINNMLGNNGHVIFDDMHQGLRNIYDADAFYKDPRLHGTLLFLLALWLTYVLGHTNCFAAACEKLKRLRLSEHISAIGDLFARRLHPSAVALRLAHHFFNEVRSYYGDPLNGEPVWGKLQDNSAINKRYLQKAMRMHSQAMAQERVNLIKFNNCLNNLRRNLQ